MGRRRKLQLKCPICGEWGYKELYRPKKNRFKYFRISHWNPETRKRTRHYVDWFIRKMVNRVRYCLFQERGYSLYYMKNLDINEDTAYFPEMYRNDMLFWNFMDMTCRLRNDENLDEELHIFDRDEDRWCMHIDLEKLKQKYPDIFDFKKYPLTPH